MKKALILYFFLFTLASSLIFPLPVNAQSSIATDFLTAPGISCGVGGATDNTSRCCDLSKGAGSIPSLPTWAESMWFIGGLVGTYNNAARRIDDVTKQGFKDPCVVGTASASMTDPSCKCLAPIANSSVPGMRDLCNKYIHSSSDVGPCVSCVNSGGYFSGIGCIPLEFSALISQYILGMGIGLAGGISLLCIMYSAFRMQTSQGNAEAIKKAQETLTSCITGLILIIFSVLILKIIAQDLLRIPGFTSP